MLERKCPFCGSQISLDMLRGFFTSISTREPARGQQLVTIYAQDVCHTCGIMVCQNILTSAAVVAGTWACPDCGSSDFRILNKEAVFRKIQGDHSGSLRLHIQYECANFECTATSVEKPHAAHLIDIECDPYSLEPGSCHFVSSYQEIAGILAKEMLKHQEKTRFTALVFGNANTHFWRINILPLIKYWNVRAKDSLSLFFAGFRETTSSGSGSTQRLTFDPNAFAGILDHFRQLTWWRYSGNTEVIIARCFRMTDDSGVGVKPFFDFRNVIVVNLEKAVRDNVIVSPEAFFEGLINWVNDSPTASLSEYSDNEGARMFWDSVADSLLMKVVGDKRLKDVAAYFRTRDLL